MPSSFVIRWLGFPYLRGRKVSRLHLTLLAASDWLTLLLLGRERPAPAPAPEGKRIVVAKIDHLGDVLMITPLLRELRAQAPSSSVALLLGSWCRELGELFLEEKLCAEVFYYDAASLNKGQASRLAKLARGLATFRQAVRRLRGADVFIDLRPFSPNALLAARLARVPHKIGFGLRGGSFLLQQELSYDPARPLGELFLGALDALGLQGVPYRGPVLTRPEPPRREAGGVALPGRYLAVHPFSRERARMTRDDLWLGLIARLAERAPVVVFGSPEDRETSLAARLAEMPGVVPLIGRTSFRAALETAGGAEGFAGVDSVFSHVALAFGLPTLVLLTKGAGLKASFPEGNSRLLFADPEEPGATPETLAAAFASLPSAT